MSVHAHLTECRVQQQQQDVACLHFAAVVGVERRRIGCPYSCDKERHVARRPAGHQRSERLVAVEQKLKVHVSKRLRSFVLNMRERTCLSAPRRETPGMVHASRNGHRPRLAQIDIQAVPTCSLAVAVASRWKGRPPVEHAKGAVSQAHLSGTGGVKLMSSGPSRGSTLRPDVDGSPCAKHTSLIITWAEYPTQCCQTRLLGDSEWMSNLDVSSAAAPWSSPRNKAHRTQTYNCKANGHCT